MGYPQEESSGWKRCYGLRPLLPFRGALVRKTIDQSFSALTWTAIQFDTVSYETDTFHLSGANTRLALSAVR